MTREEQLVPDMTTSEAQSRTTLYDPDSGGREAEAYAFLPFSLFFSLFFFLRLFFFLLISSFAGVWRLLAKYVTLR